MKNILLTRLIEDNQEDRVFFQGKGFKTVEIPLLTLRKRNASSSFEKKLNQCEWVFLTSQHAAEFFFQNQMSDQLQTKKFAVIGVKTAQVLLAHHVAVDFQALVPTKQTMFEEWSSRFMMPTTIFYPKSNLADDLGEAELMAKGHCLHTSILYDNVFSENSQRRLKKCLVEEEVSAVYLASPSLWQRFLSVFMETGLTKMPKLYCLGSTTQQAIARDGYEVCMKEKYC
ncbi:uroporphyrinogen-III synthase [Enterococcus caccae]|uniref:Uroporphyrinogen-III synthase n=1 Tax=Enterococcus caccae ATCC BAA-1240 TaxID=1158612 RepID=R3U952_9ENTE|nr:uroporphyrinogen-III synthase [Enterococcus caccae]EOL49983.1 hypothetical protein UC7_00648 [Enterococcus caccae ATCC BAA-1240]EOT56323.1 hypothetical protein I580_03123 [Enterococcus caccae ATCC BAA-1240]